MKNNTKGGVLTRYQQTIEDKNPTRIFQKLPKDIKQEIVKKALNEEYKSGQIDREVKELEAKWEKAKQEEQNLFSKIDQIKRKLKNSKLKGKAKKNQETTLLEKRRDLEKKMLQKVVPSLYQVTEELSQKKTEQRIGDTINMFRLRGGKKKKK